MWFDNIRLYLDDQNTGRLKMKFICKECNKEMDEPNNARIPRSHTGCPNYHLTTFMCDDCMSDTFKKEYECTYGN